MEVTIKGNNGTYHISSELIQSPSGVVDIDTNVYVIARDVDTQRVVKKEKFVLRQGSENSTLRAIFEMYSQQAANDFLD